MMFYELFILSIALSVFSALVAWAIWQKISKKKQVNLFFVLATVVFLGWYVPLVKGRLTVVEVAVIGINVLSFIANLSALLRKE